MFSLGHTINAGQCIEHPQYLRSSNGNYRLKVNSVVRLIKGSWDHPSKHIWKSTGCGGPPSTKYRLCLGDDGSLVAYREYNGHVFTFWSAGASIWANMDMKIAALNPGCAKTLWTSGARLHLSNNGNLYLLDGKSKIMWETGTWNGNKSGRNVVGYLWKCNYSTPTFTRYFSLI